MHVKGDMHVKRDQRQKCYEMTLAHTALACQKRPIYVKRDKCMSKETYVKSVVT